MSRILKFQIPYVIGRHSVPLLGDVCGLSSIYNIPSIIARVGKDATAASRDVYVLPVGDEFPDEAVYVGECLIGKQTCVVLVGGLTKPAA
jgi:hypothetical protein